jgi:hypothetical protein
MPSCATETGAIFWNSGDGMKTQRQGLRLRIGLRIRGCCRESSAAVQNLDWSRSVKASKGTFVSLPRFGGQCDKGSRSNGNEMSAGIWTMVCSWNRCGWCFTHSRDSEKMEQFACICRYFRDFPSKIYDLRITIYEGLKQWFVVSHPPSLCNVAIKGQSHRVQVILLTDSERSKTENCGKSLCDLGVFRTFSQISSSHFCGVWKWWVGYLQNQHLQPQQRIKNKIVKKNKSLNMASRNFPIAVGISLGMNYLPTL